MATLKKSIPKNAAPKIVPPLSSAPVIPLVNFAYSDVRYLLRQANGIQCEVKFNANQTYWSFLATPDDVEAHGRAIYAECNAGRWGPVSDYFPSEAELCAVAKERIALGLYHANIAVTKYQDRVDIDDATDADLALLSAWKKYRVSLNRLTEQPDYPHRLTWPVSPETSIP
ncbi:tail fiber assembly protein [Glaciimonas sp. GG7]